MYGLRLASIDWQRLYREYDGYLMFEDLKAQWKQFLDPDYVLIDSRTGHTDVGGICTRQLPNAVVVLFFPNEQNLRGLTKVVADIRKEAEGPRKKSIHLHFVTANVPDLDDEDRILENTFRRFREHLGYRNLSGIIHHYSSLALLNQLVFTSERPRSRLAQEYKALVKAIIRYNPEDREGVLEFLQQLVGRPHPVVARTEMPVGDVERRLNEIRTSHAGNGRILYHLALIRERQGRLEEALTLLNEAIDSGYREPEVLLQRADILRLEGRAEGAVTDLKEVLNSTTVTYFDVNRAIRWLRELAPEMLRAVPQTPALKSLDFDGRLQVTDELMRDQASLIAAEEIARELATVVETSPGRRAMAAGVWAICLIGLGRFPEAMRAVSSTRPHPLDLDVPSAFNYAMAEWAETGTPPQDLLERVRELDRQSLSEPKTANYTQCLAIVYWLLGDAEEARRRVSQARQQVMTRSVPEFSAWRYLTVSPTEFLADLDALLSGIEGKDVVPAFVINAKRVESSAGERA
jgi:tetratricopeptide (TPR) repeat protein